MTFRRQREPSAAERMRRHAQSTIQQRRRGRFARNSTNPGASVSTIYFQHQARLVNTPDDRDRNCREAIEAFLVPGEPKDFIPAHVDEGPLVQLIGLILREAHCPNKRTVFRLSKDFYIDRRRLRYLSRRNIRRNGSLVRSHAAVFPRYRIPNVNSPSEMFCIRSLLLRLIERNVCRFPDADAAIASIVPILRTYNIETQEFSNFPPLLSSVQPSSDSSSPSEQLQSLPRVSPRENTPRAQPIFSGSTQIITNLDTVPESDVTELSANNATDMIYVFRVDATAQEDKEYILLKRILGHVQDDLMPCLGSLLARNIRTGR